ncbi:MAG TPA: phosphotransferase, partial [Herpetosiphonaceae bacterium]
TMRSPAEAVARAEQQLALVPPAGRSPALLELFGALRCQPWADWAPPPPAWCRNDPNPPNFIPAAGRWRSVDWEYSGWGDGAFEIADLLAHPAYAAVPAARRAWLIAAYAAATGDPQAPERIHVYFAAMLVWWVARTARVLHGSDTRRLAELPGDWLARAEAQHETYLKWARAALA